MAADVAEELVQETAVRLLRAQPVLLSDDDLFRWCWRVCRNLELDWYRQRRVGEQLSQDVLAPDDVATAVEQRLRAATVARAMAQLSSVDQAVLAAELAELPRGETKRERDRFALQLLRARRRLATLVEGLAALLGWLRTRVRPANAELAATIGAVAVAAIATVTTSSLPPPTHLAAGRAPSGGEALSRTGHPSIPHVAIDEQNTRMASPRRTRLVRTELPNGLTVAEVATQEQDEPDHRICVYGPGIPNGCRDLPDLRDLGLGSTVGDDG